jgi:hypothetical protein
MYPYHNHIKKRIQNGELLGFTFVDDYKDLGPCLVLEFSTPPFVRPIRPHKIPMYLSLLSETSNLPEFSMPGSGTRKTNNSTQSGNAQPH